MSNLNKVIVIGAGSWGCALAMHLALESDSIFLWDIDTLLLEEMKTTRENKRYLPGISLPEKLNIETDFETAVTDADMILLVVPSHVFRDVLVQLKPHVYPGTYIVWATKGIDTENYKLLHEVVEEELGQQSKMAALSGPSFAKEVAEQQATIVDLACNDQGLTDNLHQLFDHHDFYLHDNHDFVSVQIGGALKNIVAIAVGIADGLGMGSNAKSALMTTGLLEIAELAKALGAKKISFISFSGMGDLILTCSDNKSRNRRFGLALGQGKTSKEALKEINQVVEGLQNTELALALAKKLNVSFPLAEQLQALFDGSIDAKTAIKNILIKS